MRESLTFASVLSRRPSLLLRQPAQFLNLVNAYVLQSSLGAFVSPSSYGVTLPAIVLDGVLWAVAPFIIFLYLAVKRD